MCCRATPARNRVGPPTGLRSDSLARRLDHLQVALELLVARIELDGSRVVGGGVRVPCELAVGHATAREELEQQRIRVRAQVATDEAGAKRSDGRARVVDRFGEGGELEVARCGQRT